VVEFGTSFGVSTLFLAAGIEDNGGGHLIGTEFEPTKVSATRKTVDQAGVADIVEVREGDAMKTLADDLPSEIHLVLLDGAKDMYLDVNQLLEPHLAPGALLIADNATRAVSYRDHVRNSDNYVTIFPGETVDLLVDMANPGTWLLHCHVAEHMGAGMMMAFVVE